MKEKTLKLVKARLGISTTVRDEYLKAIIDGVFDDLTNRNGIELNEEDNGHLMFVVDFSVYRYENKDIDTIPRHLRIRLNNLMVDS